jgi:hypothetical protein
MTTKRDDNMWFTVGFFMLEDYLLRLPKTDFRWPPTWDVQLPPSLLHVMLIQAEAPYSDEIDLAVEEWAESGRWRPMSEEAAAFLRIRWKPATYFFMGNVLPEDQGCKTIVPFPNLPPRKAIEWVLTDWWRRLGALKACGELILEHLEATIKLRDNEPPMQRTGIRTVCHKPAN